MRRTNATAAVRVLFVALLAAGCGGGGPSTPPTPGVVAPSAPVATSISAGAIRIAWADNSTNETGFEVRRAMSAGGPFTSLGLVNANLTGYDDLGLAPQTTYFYAVRAASAAGASAWTSTVSATTLAAAVAPPAPPSGVAAVALSSSAIRVTWKDNSTNEETFEIERASAYRPFTRVAVLSPGSTQADVGELEASTLYTFRVRAVNAAGASAWSPTATATTEAQAGSFQTAYIVASTDNEVQFSTEWTDVDPNAPQNKVYGNAPNEVGCIWTLLTMPDLSLYQSALCSAVVLRFDVSALAERTILAAGVNLFVGSPPLAPTYYTMHGLASAWSPTTITWNTLPNTYSSGGWMLTSSPGGTGWMTWTATDIVRYWVNGTWANNGVLVQDANFAFPYMTYITVTTFASLESYSDAAQRPVLVVDYQ